ncbi:MAG TPA: flotillin family protein [Kofleriaceae bacterium]|nr:flotillin family protein [Kofleriaceae bacterium]
MGFRDELGAAQARADALARRVKELEAENAALQAVDEPPAEPDPVLAPDPDPEEPLRRRFIARLVVSSLGTALVLGGAGVLAIWSGHDAIGSVAIALAATLLVGFYALVTLIEIVPPGFVLVLSGRPRPGPDGRTIGYRLVYGGRSLRVPILERADHLDVRARTIECAVRNAYSKGGEPLDVEFTAVIRLSGREPHVHNAVERFLGSGLGDVDRVARETLEGHLRVVFAELTPEEIRHDPEKLAHHLVGRAEDDFARLGIELDSFHVERVAERSSG